MTPKDENNHNIPIENYVWYIPKECISDIDNSQKYVISEIQLRKLFYKRFAPLNFNRDWVQEFIESEKLEKYE